MLFNTAALLALAPAALATITITGPSANSYWVQNASNQITWEFTQGDPNPISIIVTNPNSTFLNGPFAIAEAVDVSNKSFTVTNVTLNVHPGYVVNFVNGSNITQVYAQSAPFELKASGTTPVTQSTPAGAPGATATSPSGNGTAGNGTATSSGANGSQTAGNNNGARGTFGAVVPVFAAGALVVLGALTTL